MHVYTYTKKWFEKRMKPKCRKYINNLSVCLCISCISWAVVVQGKILSLKYTYNSYTCTLYVGKFQVLNSNHFHCSMIYMYMYSYIYSYIFVLIFFYIRGGGGVSFLFCKLVLRKQQVLQWLLLHLPVSHVFLQFLPWGDCYDTDQQLRVHACSCFPSDSTPLQLI